MKNIRISIMLSILSGLIGIFLIRNFINNQQRAINKTLKPIEVLVASQKIKAGDKFTDKNVAKMTIPSNYISKGVIRAENFEMISGKKAGQQLNEGELILRYSIKASDSSALNQSSIEIISSEF